MHSLCSGHSAPVIPGVSVASNPPRRKTNGNQGITPLAALSPPASRPQGGLRPMAACVDRAYAFDRSSNGRCALAASADAWRGVIPALRDAGASELVRQGVYKVRQGLWEVHWRSPLSFGQTSNDVPDDVKATNP